MRFYFQKFIGVLFITTFTFACVKPPDDLNEEIPVVKSQETVFIINEGNFQWGNSSISSYNLKSGKVHQNVFQSANNRPLGDVAQSAYLFNELLYIVVNNSGKIEVVNPKTFVSTKTFTGFISPRYFLPINNTKAYLSDLYANRIYVINPQNGNILEEITIQAWTEQMIMVENTIWVSSPTSTHIFLIDTQSNVLKDSIEIQIGCYNLVKDDKYVFSLSNGNSQTNQSAQIQIFDSHNLDETKKYIFPSFRRPTSLAINKKDKKIIWAEGSEIYQMPYNASTIPTTPLISIPGANIYGLDILESEQKIFIADAKDFVSKGTIYVYDTNGNKLNEFEAGIIPSKFVFY